MYYYPMSEKNSNKSSVELLQEIFNIDKPKENTKISDENAANENEFEMAV